MAPGAPDVERPQDVSTSAPGIRRERVVVRRRRAHGRHHSRKWAARSSRIKVIRAALLCTGVLMLMALGLYYGLSRQESAAVRSSHRPSPMVPARSAA
jgi:hypothetical protein